MDLTYDKKVLFINLEGILNRNTSYKINNYLLSTILKHHIKYGVLNLQKLNDIDEDGIDSLLNIKSAFKNNKGLVYLLEYNTVLIKKINKLHIKRVNNKLLTTLGV